MTRPRWPAGYVAVALVALTALAGAALAQARGPLGAEPAQAPKLFKWKFTTVMKMNWEWPVNPNNQGRRDTGSFEVLRGSGCGAKPAKSRWKVTYRLEGLPAQTLIVDFVYGGARNPAMLSDINYSGEPQAEVQPFLRFSRPTNAKVTLSARKAGDVVGPTIQPKTAKLTRSRRAVQRCPL